MSFRFRMKRQGRSSAENFQDTVPLSRAAAQDAVDRIHAFHRELAQLVKAGVIQLSAEQQQAVAAYHQGRLEQWRLLFDVDIQSQGKQFSQGMKIASFLAALGLGAAVFFLFHQYWGYFVVLEKGSFS